MLPVFVNLSYAVLELNRIEPNLVIEDEIYTSRD